jgi:hypothetical protein
VENGQVEVESSESRGRRYGIAEESLAVVEGIIFDVRSWRECACARHR